MHPTQSISRYLEALSGRRSEEFDHTRRKRPFLTISRQAGAGGRSVAGIVVSLLNERSKDVPWTMFDKELVEVVREQHNLPEDVARYMTESSVNEITDYIGNALGLHPPRFELVRKTNETIITLARMGHSVIVGRGGHVLTRSMPGGFHARLVAPLEWRVQHLQNTRGMGEKDAAAYIKEADNGRRSYVEDHFDSDWDDPLQYDCVINTGLMSFDKAAALIARHIESLS